MKICSFIPGATEVIAALGLENQLVGITHECDFPPSIRRVPVMIEPLVEVEHTTSAEIDQQVRELVAAGSPLYRLNEAAFLQAQPDLILIQDLCHVCSVTPDHLTRAMHSLPRRPDVLPLSPTSVDDMIRDVERIAQAVDAPEQGKRLAADLRHRLEQVRSRTEQHSRPRVVCLEWLDPLYVAGHWVPDMIDLAGGQDVLGSKGTPSQQTTWHDVETAQPDVVVVMPCGYSIDRTIKELGRVGHARGAWQRATESWPNLYIVDAGSYFSRPGPRLVDGVELLAAMLHPRHDHPIDHTKAIKLEASALVGDCTP